MGALAQTLPISSLKANVWSKLSKNTARRTIKEELEAGWRLRHQKPFESSVAAVPVSGVNTRCVLKNGAGRAAEAQGSLPAPWARVSGWAGSSAAAGEGARGDV